MIALFVLIAVVSAKEYIIAEEGAVAKVKVIGECQTFVKNDDYKSTQYIKVDDKKYKDCTYKEEKCGGNGECTEIELSTGEKYVSQLPEYAFRNVEDSHSSSCENADKAIDYIIYKSGCHKAEENMYIKVEVDDDNIVSKIYSDDKCTTEKSNQGGTMKCGQCKSGAGESIKYICGTSSMMIFTLLVLFAFLF